MSENKISDFFTPSRSSSKRQRSHISPESEEKQSKMVSGKVCDLTQEELLSSLSVTLGAMLDTKLANLATKEDFSCLADKVSKLEEENRALRQEIQSLKAKDGQIAEKLIDLESRSRRNNLIFKGIKGAEKTKDCKMLIDNFCRDVFGSDGKLWINRAHHLGKDKRTLIAHFPDDCDIQYIMSRTRCLQNTGCVVHRDFPREIREKRAALMSVRREVERVAGRRKMPLVHDHLMIEGCRFSWQDGKLMAGRQDGEQRLQTLMGHDFSSFLRNLKLGGQGHEQRRFNGSRADGTKTTTDLNDAGGSVDGGGDDNGGGDNRGGGSSNGDGGTAGNVNQAPNPAH